MIHDHLKTALKESGLSIREIGRRTGIRHTVISEWLAGKRNRRMGDVQLDDIANAIGHRWQLVEGADRTFCPNPLASASDNTP